MHATCVASTLRAAVWRDVTRAAPAAVRRTSQQLRQDDGAELWFDANLIFKHHLKSSLGGVPARALMMDDLLRWLQENPGAAIVFLTACLMSIGFVSEAVLLLRIRKLSRRVKRLEGDFAEARAAAGRRLAERVSAQIAPKRPRDLSLPDRETSDG